MLLTDAAPGEDETCASSAWDTVATIAGERFAAGHGPNTHVISVMGTAVVPDHWAKLDYENFETVARAVGLTSWRLANSPEAVTWMKENSHNESYRKAWQTMQSK